MLIDVGDTRLHVTERGEGELPLFLLHGGPGLDHTMFGSYLDALGDRCRLLLVDERGTGRSEPAPPGTWALAHHAADVEAMAGALGLDRYAVLGHSYGAFIALQHAVDFPGSPAATVVSSGIADARFLAHVEEELAAFEPVELREQVQSSWAREAEAHTQEDVASLLSDQLPFHFADPRDPRIEEMRAAMADAVYGPDVLRAAATEDYGAIAVEDRLADVTHPVLVLAGRHDRTCPVAAAEAMVAGLPDAELVVFEDSGHMTFVEENAAYLAAVRDFLGRRAPG
ncbi:MAG TPA: alpha/beta fold hydrolase [Solirubrobacteraceae bacterium]|nr:alpha/beta fold hydrolase [Solirubrobacteraceae bacterium]